MLFERRKHETPIDPGFRLISWLMLIPFMYIAFFVDGCAEDPGFRNQPKILKKLTTADFTYQLQVEQNASWRFSIDPRYKFTEVSSVNTVRRIDGRDTTLIQPTLSVIGAGQFGESDSVQMIESMVMNPDTYLVSMHIEYAEANDAENFGDCDVLFNIMILPEGSMSYVVTSMYQNYSTQDDSFYVRIETVGGLAKKGNEDGDLKKTLANVSKVQIDQQNDGTFEREPGYNKRAQSPTVDIMAIDKSYITVLAQNCRGRIIFSTGDTSLVSLPVTRTDQTVLTPVGIIISGTANGDPLTSVINVPNVIDTLRVNMKLVLLMQNGTHVPVNGITNYNVYLNQAALAKNTLVLTRGDSIFAKPPRTSIPNTSASQLSVRDITVTYTNLQGGSSTYTHQNSEGEFIYTLVPEGVQFQYHPSVLEFNGPAVTQAHQTNDSTDVAIQLRLRDSNQSYIPLDELTGLTLTFIPQSLVAKATGGGKKKISRDDVDRMIDENSAKKISFDRNNEYVKKIEEKTRNEHARQLTKTHSVSDLEDAPLLKTSSVIKTMRQSGENSTMSLMASGYRIIVSVNSGVITITVRFRSASITQNEIITISQADVAFVDNGLVRIFSDRNIHSFLVTPRTNGAVVVPDDTMFVNFASPIWQSVAGSNSRQGTAVIANRNGGIVNFTNLAITTSPTNPVFSFTTNGNLVTAGWTGESVAQITNLNLRASFNYDSAGIGRSRSNIPVVPVVTVYPINTPTARYNVEVPFVWQGLSSTYTANSSDSTTISWTISARDNNSGSYMHNIEPTTTLSVQVDTVNPSISYRQWITGNVVNIRFRSNDVPQNGVRMAFSNANIVYYDSSLTRYVNVNDPYTQRSITILRNSGGTMQWALETDPRIPTIPATFFVTNQNADTSITFDLQWWDRLLGIPVNTFTEFTAAYFVTDPALPMTIQASVVGGSVLRVSMTFNKSHVTSNTVSLTQILAYYTDTGIPGVPQVAISQSSVLAQFVIQRTGGTGNQYNPANTATITGFSGTVVALAGQDTLRDDARIQLQDVVTGNYIPLTSYQLFYRWSPTGPQGYVVNVSPDSIRAKVATSSLTAFSGNALVKDSVRMTFLDYGIQRTVVDRVSQTLDQFVPYSTNQWVQPVQDPFIIVPDTVVWVSGDNLDTLLDVRFQIRDANNNLVTTADTIISVVATMNPNIPFTIVPAAKINGSTLHFYVRVNESQVTNNVITINQVSVQYMDNGRRFTVITQNPPAGQFVVRKVGTVVNTYNPASTATITMPGTVTGQQGQAQVRAGALVTWRDLTTGGNIPLTNIMLFGYWAPSGVVSTVSYVGTDSLYLNADQATLVAFNGNDFILDSLRAQFMDQLGLRTVVDRSSRVITHFTPFSTSQWNVIGATVSMTSPVNVSGDNADTLLIGTIQLNDNGGVPVSTLDSILSLILVANPNIGISYVPMVKLNNSTYQFGVRFNESAVTSPTTVSLYDGSFRYLDNGRQFLYTPTSHPFAQFIVQKSGTVTNQYNPASTITLTAPSFIQAANGQTLLPVPIKASLANLTPPPSTVPATSIQLFARFTGGTIPVTYVLNYAGSDTATITLNTSTLNTSGGNDLWIDSTKYFYTDNGNPRWVTDNNARLLTHIEPFVVTNNRIYTTLSLEGFPSSVQAIHPLTNTRTSFQFGIPTIPNVTITSIDENSLRGSFNSGNDSLNNSLLFSVNQQSRIVTVSFMNRYLTTDPDVLNIWNIRANAVDVQTNTYLYIDSLPSVHSTFVQKWQPLSTPAGLIEISGLPSSVISSPFAVTRVGFRMRLPNISGGYISYTNPLITATRDGVPVLTSEIQFIGQDSVYMNLRSISDGSDTTVSISSITVSYDGGYGSFTDNTVRSFILRPATAGNTIKPYLNAEISDLPETFNGSNQSRILAASNQSVTTDTITVLLRDSVTGNPVNGFTLTDIGSIGVVGQPSTVVTHQLISGNRIVYTIQSSVLNAGPVTLRLNGVTGTYVDYTGLIAHVSPQNYDFAGYPRSYLYTLNPIIASNSMPASFISLPTTLSDVGGAISLTDSITGQGVAITNINGTASASGVSPILFGVTTLPSFKFTYTSAQVSGAVTMNYNLVVSWTELGDTRTKSFSSSTLLRPVTDGDNYSPDGTDILGFEGKTLKVLNSSDTTSFSSIVTLLDGAMAVPNATIVSASVSITGITPVVRWSGNTLTVKIDTNQIPVNAVRSGSITSITMSYPDYSGQKQVVLTNQGSFFVTRDPYGSNPGGPLVGNLPNNGDTVRVTEDDSPTGIFNIQHYEGISYNGGASYVSLLPDPDSLWNFLKDTSISHFRATLINLQTGARDSSISRMVMMATTNTPGANNTFVLDSSNVIKYFITLNGGFISSPATQAIEIRMRLSQLREASGTGSTIPEKYIIFYFRRQ